MPRKPKIPTPWPRKDRGGDWYVTIRQRQHFLAPADAPPDDVQKALAELLMQANVETSREAGPVLPLFDRFLEHVKLHQADETYRMRRKDLQSFVNYLKRTGQKELAVEALKPYHVTQWLDGKPTWGPSSRRVAINSLMTALNWSVREGYIDRHPLEGKVRRPPRKSRGREVYMDEGTYREWLGFCRHPQQRHVIMAMWQTGCRPGEVIGLGGEEGTGFDEGRGTWTVKGKSTKDKPTGYRVVALTPFMVELSKHLRERHPTGHLFRNCVGNPWDLHLVGQMFRRFRRKSARLHPERANELERLIPYSARHTWATNRLRDGHSETLVARQMGHKGTAMLHEHYDHVLAQEALPMMQSIKPLDGETL
jgi:integrase